MLDELRLDLAELGLSQKEADVYLGMLELGPASVQSIAEKAGVNRTTTYLLIDALKKRGLVSTLEKQGKTCFVPEHPQRFVSMVVQELSGIEAKRARLESCLPKLLAIFNTIDDKPIVRFFEGEDALNAIRTEIAQSNEAVWEVYAVDENLIEQSKIGAQKRVETTEHVRVRGRALMAVKPGCIPPYFEPRKFEARLLDYQTYPFAGDVVINGPRLYVLTAKPLSMGIIVESKEVANIFRALYEAAWKTAKPWTPPADWK